MTVLYLNSDQIGAGDATLGRRLLRSFLTTLVASEVPLDFVVCANAGVFLTTEGSEVLDVLHTLEVRGATVASCATCLDHHGRRDRLAVGVIGSMGQTVELFATADRVIAPC